MKEVLLIKKWLETPKQQFIWNIDRNVALRIKDSKIFHFGFVTYKKLNWQIIQFNLDDINLELYRPEGKIIVPINDVELAHG